jgi:S1-C subfamily serine protease
MRVLVVAFVSLVFALILSPYPGYAAKPARVKSLAERFEAASCAVVQIVTKEGMGTGFFTSPDGDIITASHVALNRTFSQPAPGQIAVTIDYKPELRVVRNNSEPIAVILPKLEPDDTERAMTDLAILKTGLKTSCYLHLSAHPLDSKIGAHVIAIGFPLSAPKGALYEGFVSATYQHLPIPLALVNDIPIMPNYEVIRVQMPITPGASGAPVIADDGDVIGVVTENPTTWFQDLNALIQYEQVQQGGFNAPTSDLAKMTAKLAWVVQEFLTSGAGLAVPVSYLKMQGPTGERSGSPIAKDPGSALHRNWFRSLLDYLK